MNELSSIKKKGQESKLRIYIGRNDDLLLNGKKKTCTYKQTGYTTKVT